MSRPDFLAAFVASLNEEDLAALAARLRPHLDPAAAELLSPKEAAARLGLHEKTVVRMAREGRLPGALKVGREWRFPADGLAPLPAVGVPIEPMPRRARGAHSGGRRSVQAIRDAT